MKKMPLSKYYRQRYGPRGYRGMPKKMCMFRKSKLVIRWLLQNPWIRPMCVFNYAAIIVQKLFRGHLVRTYGRNWKKQLQTHKISSNKIARKSRQGMLNKYLSYLDHFRTNKLPIPQWLEEGYSSWCVVRIQSWWRMTKCYQNYKRIIRIFFRIAAMNIQSLWRSYNYKKYLKSGVSRQMKKIHSFDQAALIIQLCWRSFCNKRIYKYFLDLLKYKLQGEPIDLLRAIAPGEADLLDRAAGIHVRFRLGGISFPPKIYFKIYTHRPLCDVNAFAPRNYTKERPAGTFQSHLPTELLKNEKMKLKSNTNSNIRVGNSQFKTTVNISLNKETWYHREENNDWRTISTQKVEEYFEPPSWLHMKTSVKKIQPFHYSRLRRQQDINLERKRRKREWMMKAYMLTASGKNPEEEDSDTRSMAEDSKLSDVDLDNNYSYQQQQSENKANVNNSYQYKYDDDDHNVIDNDKEQIFKDKEKIHIKKLYQQDTVTSDKQKNAVDEDLLLWR